MSTHDSPTLADRLFVATQHAIPQHFLSRLVYRLTRSRLDSVKNALIKAFMRGFSPDMSDAVRRDPLVLEARHAGERVLEQVVDHAHDRAHCMCAYCASRRNIPSPKSWKSACRQAKRGVNTTPGLSVCIWRWRTWKQTQIEP